MKKRVLIVTFILLLSMTYAYGNKTNSYVIISSIKIKQDNNWMKVVTKLANRHDASILFYNKDIDEVISDLKRLKPQYVAFIDKPENIGKEYVFRANQLSYLVDEDIYPDFLWGIITGYNASAAMRLIDNSVQPFIINTALSTIMELKAGKWFDEFAFIDDHNLGVFGEKDRGEKNVTIGEIKDFRAVNDKDSVLNLLGTFSHYYAKINPDLIVTAAHATEINLEMPFSKGNIKSENGVLYADFYETKKILPLRNMPRVYLPIGNCLIGNVAKTKYSMPIAWMNSGGATSMVGYVVPTWHGRNGWGTLKYWLTYPGRYTLAQAFYLNKVDMIHQLNKWHPKLVKYDYPHRIRSSARAEIEESLNRKLTIDERGFWYDKDVVALYGDPAWDVRLKADTPKTDFTVVEKEKKGKLILTIQTHSNFDLNKMKGEQFKEEHVKDLPFSYIFSNRLKNPRISNSQKWDIALTENCILIYNDEFHANSLYTIVIEHD